MMDNQPDKELNVAYALLNPMNWLKLVKELFNLGKWLTSSSKNKAIAGKENSQDLDKTKTATRDSSFSQSVDKKLEGLETAKKNRRPLSSITAPAIQASTTRNAKIGRSMSVPNISLSK